MKNVVKYILSIILAIMIISIYLINLVSSTVLSKRYVLSKLEKEDYYTKIYEQVKSNFEKYIYQSGLEEDVLSDIVSKEKIKKDTETVIKNIYDGLNQEIETDEIIQKLNENIDKSLKDRYISEKERESIDKFVNYICDEYKLTISYFNFETSIGQNFDRLIYSAKIYLLAIASIDFILLFVLNLKQVYRFISLIGLSFSISGFSLIFTTIFVNIRIKVRTITILNDIISDVIRNIFVQCLNLITRHGILMLILGICLIFVSNLIANIKKAKLK